jgi:hypothetical protein
MHNSNIDINDFIISIVEKLRFAEKSDQNCVNHLYDLLDQITVNYTQQSDIPKQLAYSLLVLHDNLEGALNYYHGDELAYLSGINSRINGYIEKILL